MAMSWRGDKRAWAAYAVLATLFVGACIVTVQNVKDGVPVAVMAALLAAMIMLGALRMYGEHRVARHAPRSPHRAFIVNLVWALVAGLVAIAIVLAEKLPSLMR